MSLSQLMDPDVYAKLTPKEIEQLTAFVNEEVVNTPEISKQLRAKVDAFLPTLQKGKP